MLGRQPFSRSIQFGSGVGDAGAVFDIARTRSACGRGRRGGLREDVGGSGPQFEQHSQLALIIGTTVGMYSSLVVAAPLFLWMEGLRPSRPPRPGRPAAKKRTGNRAVV